MDTKARNDEKVAKFIEEMNKQGLTLADLSEALQVLIDSEAVTTKEGSEMDVYARVTDILREIGVPAHLKGFEYNRTAIVAAVENPEMMYDGITKRLYPFVAKQHHTTSSRAERAIRHAIESAWDRGDVDVLERYFGNTVSRYKGKPTNSEFIATIVQRLNIERRKRL